MALLIGGPEEKYARLELGYHDMLKMVELESSLQGIPAALGTGSLLDVHRHAHLVTAALDNLAGTIASGLQIADRAPASSHYFKGDPAASILALIYDNAATAMQAVEVCVRSISEKLGKPSRAAEPLYDFQRDLLSVTANAICNNHSAAFGSPGVGRNTPTARLPYGEIVPKMKADAERVSKLQAAWRAVVDLM